jgi:transcriptional regulator with XRE-family HTH domain
MKFAERLKEVMEIRKMNQSELSALTGIGKPSISQYLSGKNEPKHDKMKKLAEALEVTESWLTGNEVEMDGYPKNDETITTEQAAKLMGKSKEFVRVGLQRGILPFGTAVKLSSRWTYYISPVKFFEFIGKVD